MAKILKLEEEYKILNEFKAKDYNKQFKFISLNRDNQQILSQTIITQLNNTFFEHYTINIKLITYTKCIYINLLKIAL